MENNNKNYGRQLKVTRYMIQRAYFEGMLRYHIDNPSKDGDFSERYIGHIFPENVLWLKENGIKVHTERITDASHKFFDCEVNVLTISDDITALTEEEIKESEAHCANAMAKIAEENFKEFMEALGLSADEEDDDDDNDDDDDDEDFRLPDFDDDDVDFSLPDTDEDEEENEDGNDIKPPYSV